MCETCSCNVSSIPGPGEVASGAVGLAVGAAGNKGTRRVLFWGFAVPMLPFAIWGELHWWTLALVAVLAVATGAGGAYVRFLHHGHTVIARREPTPQMRAALAARGLRAIPAPGQARPALPRGLSITRKRQALPPAAKALPAGYVTGKVVPAPVRRAAR